MCFYGESNVDGRSFLVFLTRKDKTIVDWKPLAGDVGTAIRNALEGGGPLIAEKIIADLPAEEDVRKGIQENIDAEVNPGVAGHGGHITLQSVKGNTITDGRRLSGV